MHHAPTPIPPTAIPSTILRPHTRELRLARRTAMAATSAKIVMARVTPTPNAARWPSPIIARSMSVTGTRATSARAHLSVRAEMQVDVAMAPVFLGGMEM